MDVAVIGGPSNVADGARSSRLRFRPRGVHAASTAGVLGLRENAALIGMAALFVGMDSGPGHIAAALGVPVVIVSVPSPRRLAGSSSRAGAVRTVDRSVHALVLRPAAHRDPCADGCEADAPHCILELRGGRRRGGR